MEGTNQECLIHMRNMLCASEVFNKPCLGNIAILLFEAVTTYLRYTLIKRIRAVHSSLNPPCIPPRRSTIERS